MSVNFSGPIWEGIYSDFNSAKASGDGFSGHKWTESVKAAAGSVSKGNVAALSGSLLPVVASIAPSRQKSLRILDFGGGPGATFGAVTAAVQGRPLDYHVVENRNVCAIGREVFSGNRELTFHETLPPDIGAFDIAHFGSSIQYVEQWRELIQKLASCEPSMFLFTELTVGDVPTFASMQNYYGSKIPMWFLNIQEFTDFLKGLGYRLAFRDAFRGRYLGVEQPLPQQNFPAEYRIGYASHALFVK